MYEEQHNFYCAPNAIDTTVKNYDNRKPEGRLYKNVKFLLENLEGKDHLGEPRITGMIMQKWILK